MKQIQVIYRSSEDFTDRVCEIRKQCEQLSCTSVLVHIFMSKLNPEIVKNISGILDDELPKALYIGCTTNANIMNGVFTEDEVDVIFSLYEDPNTRIVIYQYNLKGKSVQELAAMALEVRQAMPWVKYCELLVSSYGMLETNLTQIFKNLEATINVFGGGAYTGDKRSDSYVFAKGWQPNSTSVVMVFMGGSGLHIKTQYVTGWRPLGHSFEITKAEGNVLYTLNGRPAFDIYSKYLNIENDEDFEDNVIEFPLMCSTRRGTLIMRTPISSREDGSIVLFSEIDLFPSVRLAYGDRQTILDDIRRTAEEMMEFRPQGIMLFSCVARRAYWKDDINRESAIFQNLAPTCGFYTSGEIITNNDRIYHHNETLLVVSLREGDVDETLPLPELPVQKEAKTYSLNNRLVQFATTATVELERTNNDLDKMVEELNESRMQAEAANRAKSDFLANMSHEIRTPINAILGFNTMIKREAKNPQIIKYADDIMGAGNSLLSIINDILDLSKIESGKMEIVPVEYEISSLLLDVVNMMKMKAADKGLRINLNVDSNIPVWLLGDDVRIKQIIVNLMNNAVKYTEHGTVTLNVHGIREGENERLYFEIKDTGIGIKPEDIDKLFEKFKRIEESRNHSIEGTGLGMNITINLLAMMNSKLDVKSNYGEGSKFSFEILQKVVREGEIGDINTRVNKRRDDKTYKAKFEAPEARVLVVDDNRMNREVIIALLKHTHIIFDQADGGYSCLEKTNTNKYDLILLDHMMPDLDGVKTLHIMKASENNLNRYTPIVCMTANAITGAREEYLCEGFESYISKPVKPNELEQLLAEMLPDSKVIYTEVMEPQPDELQNQKKSDAKKNQADSKKEDVSLPQVEGINIELALKNLSTPQLVIESMKTFVTTAALEADTLERIYKSTMNAGASDELTESVKGFRIKVHAMKSTSLTIGAVMISNMAKYLEYCARDSKFENIRSVTPAFLDEWRDTAGRLKKELDRIAPESKEKIPFEKDEFLKKINELSRFMQDMDIDKGDEIIIELKKYSLPEKIESMMPELEAAVTNIDLGEVDRLVSDMSTKV